MKKKLLIAFLALTAALCCAFGFTACGNSTEKKLAEILNFSEIGITGEGKVYEVYGVVDDLPQSVIEGTTELEIPATYKNLPVVSIHQFSVFKNLKSITLPEGLRRIGFNTFSGCSALKNINIPSSVTEIEEEVFSGCTALESIDIPDSITKFGNGAFKGCTALKEINFSGVTEIGVDAFRDCTALEEINIPDSITKIDDYAFRDCTALEKINFPDSEFTIMSGVFSNCTALKEIIIPNGATFYFGIFSGCTSINKITLPCIENSHIGYIFKNSTNAAEGSDVPDSLETVILTKRDTSTTSFRDCTSIKNVTLPDNVTEIIDFSGCTALNNIVIPDSVTTINQSAFSGCTALEEINIPDNVTKIDSNAFGGCTSLKNVNFSDDIASKSKLSYIGSSAFSQCENLINISIPEKVTMIESTAFSGCHSLMGVFLSAADCTVEYGVFNEAGKNSTGITLKVNKSVKSIPKNFMNECTGLLEINFVDDCECTVIGEDAFLNCRRLNSVNLSDNIEKIESGAFGNTGLIRITIPYSVKDIEPGAFGGSYKLVEICNLSNIEIIAGSGIAYNVKRVYDGGISAVFQQGNFTFFLDNSTGRNEYYLIGIHNKFATDITLPSSVIMLGSKVSDTYRIYDRAFTYSNIKSITINSTAVNIDDSTGYVKDFDFTGCDRLESININADIKKYSSHKGILLDKTKNYIVYIPEKIKEIELPDTVQNFNKTEFKNLTALESINLPANITYINNEMFSGCISLKNIVIPEGVTSIGSAAFSGCNALASITIPDSVTQLGQLIRYNGQLLITGTIINSSFTGTINFGGTIEQWKAIIKASSDNIKNLVIHCIDGDTVYGDTVKP